MLHSLLITNHRVAADLLAHAIRESGLITLEQVFCPSPTPYQLSRALNTLALDAVFVDTTDIDHAEMVCAEIAKKSSSTAVIGFSAERGNGHDRVTAHTLPWPLSTAGVRDSVHQAIRALSAKPLENVYCLLPAKGGAGATTIAVNVACHLSTSFGKSVLVADADLRSGTIADRLNTKPTQSMAQSLASADTCMSLIWPRHVARKFGVDWMLTDRARDFARPQWCDYRHLLNFASARYDYTFVDLPEFLDEAAAEAVLLARNVFVATTPEVLSLRLARERVQELESLGVPKSRIRVLANRLRFSDMSADDISKLVGCEMAGVFPNDYEVVDRSIVDATFVDGGTKLGRAYRSLAGVIAGDSQPALGLETELLPALGFLTSLRRSNARAWAP